MEIINIDLTKKQTYGCKACGNRFHSIVDLDCNHLLICSKKCEFKFIYNLIKNMELSPKNYELMLKIIELEPKNIEFNEYKAIYALSRYYSKVGLSTITYIGSRLKHFQCFDTPLSHGFYKCIFKKVFKLASKTELSPKNYELMLKIIELEPKKYKKGGIFNKKVVIFELTKSYETTKNNDLATIKPIMAQGSRAWLKAQEGGSKAQGSSNPCVYIHMDEPWPEPSSTLSQSKNLSLSNFDT